MSNIDTDHAKSAFIYAIRSHNIKHIGMPHIDVFSVIDDNDNIWFNIMHHKDSDKYSIEHFTPIINEYRLRKIPQNVEPNAKLLMPEIKKQLALPAQFKTIISLNNLQR